MASVAVTLALFATVGVAQEGPIGSGASPFSQPAAPVESSSPVLPAQQISPPPPAEAQGPTITVRGGEHPQYTRLVFDWTDSVDFTVDRTAGSMRIRFDTPAQANLSGAQRSGLSRIAAVAQVPGLGGLAVSAAIPEPARLRTLRVGTKVVVDVYGPALSTAERAAASEAVAQTETVREATVPGATEAVVRRPAIPLPRRKPTILAAGAGDGSADLVASGGLTSAESPTTDTPSAPSDEPVIETIADTAPTVAAPVAPNPSAPPSPGESPASDAAVPVTAGASAPATPVSASITERPAAATPTPPTGSAAERQPTAEAVDAPIETSAAASPVIVFDPGGPAAAAVFVRGGMLTVVFDRDVRTDSVRVVDGNVQLVGAVRPVPALGGSAFQVPVRPWLRPAVARRGTAWEIDVVPDTRRRSRRVPIVPQPGFVIGARVLVASPDATAFVEMTDPEVGDRLLAVPLPAVVEHVPQAHRLPQVDFLRTLQGAVIRPKADGITVRPVQDGLEVTSAGGLLVSPPEDMALGEALEIGAETDVSMEALPPPPTDDRRLFNLVDWQQGPLGAFTDERQRLLQRVVSALPSERMRARLDLAQFYFAHGFLHEARGLLLFLGDQEPDLVGWPEFQALVGAIEVAIGDPERGRTVLSSGGLAENREAALWRAMAAAKLGEWPMAANGFAAGKNIVNEYPEPHFSRFIRRAAEAELETGDPESAEEVLDRLLDKGAFDVAESPGVLYLRGEARRQSGDPDEAIALWQQVRGSNDRLYRARAGLDLINLELEEDRTTPEAAAERLAQLRFAWRGDDLELDIVQRQGEVQWLAGQYADSLLTLREAAAMFPDNPRSAEITRTMARNFAGLFQDGASDLPPLEALELYDRFRELTPVGAAGDAIIRALAGRLAELDLLASAADLLEHQVTFRLDGPKKAEVGARLASLRLLDGRPAQALEGLDMSQMPDLSAELVRERRLLRARALTDLRRSEEALSVIAGDDGDGANLLRVDIAWREQKWNSAAQALDRVIGPPPEDGTPLDPRTAQLIVDRAVALALAGDGRRLETLRSKYGAAIESTDQAAAFQVLTRPEQTGGLVDLKTIEQRVAEVDVFQDFLNQYRTRHLAEDADPATAIN